MIRWINHTVHVNTVFNDKLYHEFESTEEFSTGSQPTMLNERESGKKTALSHLGIFEQPILDNKFLIIIDRTAEGHF
ncbi:MAG: hypothetical protein JSV18_00620 [Candidatus Bathyarchaeota archaeon]|nr:MAG: hypothetical protein JSV18_00620 [Candidatus Bathyarchaeota archaeon]